jgi:predicted NBD/HSP70 family sugar kinase
MQGGTKTFQKNVNLSLVLRTIRLEETISRIDIARTLGLNRSTITYIASQLLEEGIIHVLSEGEPAVQGGRKPVYLGLNGDYGAVLGMEIQYNLCRAVVLGLDGRVLVKKSVPYSGTNIRLGNRCGTTFEMMEREVRQFGIPLIGVGIGLPGLIDPHGGKIIQSFSLKLHDFDFAEAVAKHFEVPVLIDNDANCCAWGEVVANRGKGPDNFLYLLPKFNTEEEDPDKVEIVGLGVGTVINGNVYYGNNYAAGEFRSVLWEKGNKEQVAIDGMDLRKIETDKTVLRAFIKEVCFNLSVIISLLNPGRIYIGGDLGKHFDLVREVIGTELSHSYIGDTGNGCEIAPTDYDIYDVAVGAANMFLEKLFDIPGLQRQHTYYSLDWDRIFGQAVL